MSALQIISSVVRCRDGRYLRSHGADVVEMAGAEPGQSSLTSGTSDSVWCCCCFQLPEVFARGRVIKAWSLNYYSQKCVNVKVTMCKSNEMTLHELRNLILYNWLSVFSGFGLSSTR